MMSHTSTLKWLCLKKIFGKCVRKKFSQGVGVPGLPRENNAVAQYQEFFFYPPPGPGRLSGLLCAIRNSSPTWAIHPSVGFGRDWRPRRFPVVTGAGSD